MKIFARFCIYTAVALGATGARAASISSQPTTKDAALTVSAKDRTEGNDYWRKLGVTPPQGGFILTHPWSPPWSGRSLIVPATWFEQAFDTFEQASDTTRQHRKDKSPLPIDAAALRKDLPILHMALEKSYSGWETAAKLGWNWDVWFKRWDTMLAGLGEKTIPDDQAFAPWFAYESFQIDSHSGPIVPSNSGKVVSSRSALLAVATGATCTSLETTDGKQHALNARDPAQQPHAVENWNGEVLQPASYVVYPSSLGTARSVICDDRRIAVIPFWNAYSNLFQPLPDAWKSVVDLSGGNKGLAIYNTPAPDIGYLRLAAFDNAGDEALAKLLPKLPQSAGHEKLLIVDLRGNGGGGAPIELLSRWIPLKQLVGQFTKISKRSCLYPGLWFNQEQVLSLGVKQTSAQLRETESSYARGISAPATTTCPVSFQTAAGKWEYARHHFVRAWRGQRPRLLVLVDDGCGSDCEYMAWLLAQLPGTVMAGANTFGLIGFTQPGFMLLPHTHIVFRLATSRSEVYGDGRSENGYGLDVDVTLPTAANWSRESILALARQLEGSPGHTARH